MIIPKQEDMTKIAKTGKREVVSIDEMEKRTVST